MSLNYASQVQKSTNAASAEVSSVRDADKSKPYIPCAGEASDGWSNDDEATATCFCGSVQLSLVSNSLLVAPSIKPHCELDDGH